MTSQASIDPSFCAEAFSLSPDPHRLFLGPDHAEALAGLKIGLQYRRGLMVVVGEVGMGKTTIAYSFLASLGDDVRTAYIANTRVPFDALLRHAVEDFGIESAERDRADLLSALKEFLLECAAVDRLAVLVIDEAQSLDDETFENLRLLSNVETYRQKLLQIVLLGQPELDMRLQQPQLRQIAERVGVRVNINPLDRAASHRYIQHRLEKAAGSVEMFSPPALRYIVRRARGVPRRINILCHNALLLAYAAGSTQVTRSMAKEAARELMGGTLHRLTPPVTRAAASAAHRTMGRWAAAATALVAGGFFAATGLVHRAATPGDTGATTVPWSVPAEPPHGAAAGEKASVANRPSHEEAGDPDVRAGAPQVVNAQAGVTSGDAVPVVKGDPPREPVITSEAVAAPLGAGERNSSGPVEVTVEPGATLRSIARRFYGDQSPEVIRRIVQGNPALNDPNVIYAGTKLVLPPVPEGEAEARNSQPRGEKGVRP